MSKCNGIVKVCTTCGYAKPTSSFSKSKSGKYGTRSACKSCTNIYNANYRANNLEAVSAASTKWRAENKEKVSQYNKAYYEENYVPRPRKKRSSKKEADREYYLLNRDKIIARATTWNKENPERSRDHGRKTQRRKRMTAKGRIDDAISANMRNAIKENKAGRKWESLVGYSINDLMMHLEFLFQKGMTWENYGRDGWHIDHIIPQSAFNYEDTDDIDFKLCWSLDNLQPLWSTDNIKKGAKLRAPFQPSLQLAVNDNHHTTKGVTQWQY